MYDLNDNEFDLTIYVPTRGRPDNADRLQHEAYLTSRINTRIMFILSEDDPKINDYKNLEFSLTVAPERRGFVEPLNLGYLKDRRKVYSYALGFMGDDHIPRTEGWDEIIVNELIKLKSGFVYGNDGFQGIKLPTQITMTSDIPLTLGFMTLPALSHLYADNWWLDFGKAINRIKYLPDLVIEHMHPAAGKASQDAGYDFSSSFTLDLSDESIYNSYLECQLEADVKNVLGMMRRTRHI